MAKNVLVDFDNPAKGIKKLQSAFARAGAPAVETSAEPKIKRTSGISFREIDLTFADSQQISFRIKQSGDIFQVLLNGAVIPIKNQDDHIKAVGEIVGRLDAGRSAYQKKLAKIAVKPPTGIKATAPKLVEALTEKRDTLKEAIAATREEIAKLAA